MTAPCPVLSEVLTTGDVTQDAGTRAVLASDPGVQSGWVLAVRSAGRVVALASWLIGRRAQRARGRVALVPAEAPGVMDHVDVIDAALEMYVRLVPGAVDAPRPVVACEDWFAGVNPNTARDVARQFYFVEAAAQSRDLAFRAVANQTWKKSFLGRGNMKSDEALLAYAAKAHAEYPHVLRWGGQSLSGLTTADDAAALGVAHWYLETEST